MTIWMVSTDQHPNVLVLEKERATRWVVSLHRDKDHQWEPKERPGDYFECKHCTVTMVQWVVM